MRDGTRLSVDLIRPELPGPLPVVLVRTPYDKVLERSAKSDFYETLAQRGYIIAVQDCRGRFNSDGAFFPYINELDDGYDSVDWVAAQDWCDGNIGMTGGSYVGQTSWFAAARNSPHLKVIVPFVSPPGTLFRTEPIFNGVFLRAMSEWMRDMGRRAYQKADFTSIFTEDQSYFDVFPLGSVPAAAGAPNSWWDEMMRHPNCDDFWKQGSYDNWSNISVPALNITGWYDMSSCGAPSNLEAMKKQ